MGSARRPADPPAGHPPMRQSAFTRHDAPSRRAARGPFWVAVLVAAVVALVAADEAVLLASRRPAAAAPTTPAAPIARGPASTATWASEDAKALTIAAP